MKKTKLLALLLAVLMVVSVFAACGGNESSGSQTENSSSGASGNSNSSDSGDGGEDSSEPEAQPGEVTLPIVDEKITITWFTSLDGNLTTLVENMNETPFFQQLEEKTNIHIQFDHPASGNESTAYNLLFASGELPDMVSHQNPGYPGGLDACIDDGYILDLTDLVPQYCPNYMKVLTEYSDTYDQNVRRSAYTGTGRIGALSGVFTEPQGPWAGLYVRGDWLEECGLDTPETYDDWEEMLTAFKDKCGATAPLLLGKSGYDALYNVLSVGCGVTCAWYQEDGQVKFGPAEEGWREYVTKMHDWYEKGLIDPDFMASTAPVMFVPDTAMVTTGKTGAFMGIYTNVAMWEAAIEGDEDNFVPVYAPMQKAGDTHDFHGVLLSTATATGGLSISAKSEYAVECLKLFDYWFTEEGTTFCNYGIEDDTFKIDDSGKPSFTEKVTANADGLSFAQAMAYFTFPPARPVHQDWTRELAAVPQKDLVSFDVWGKGTRSKSMPAPASLSMDPDLYNEYSTIMADIQTVVDEKTPQFISGVISLDEYDAYLDTINSMQMSRAVEIVQEAYDAFMAR